MPFWSSIMLGESRVEEPAGAPGLRELAADEGGTISLVSLIVVLVFLVLIGLVGNIGQAVVQSIEVQNAADSAAVSSGVWIARGLNAVTTTNHIMGELTALLVVSDAFLGPEEIPAGQQQRNESVRFNEVLELLAPFAPFAGALANAATAGEIHEVDEKLVDELKEMLVKDKGKHPAGASVYDARMTLKYLTCIGFAAKGLANALAIIGDVTVFFAVAGEVIAAGIHLAVDFLLLKIAQEWIFLQGVEAGTSALRQGLQSAVPPVIGALSKYSDSVAGRTVGSIPVQTPINNELEATLEVVRDAHRMTDVALFPAPRIVRLPVSPERSPDDAQNEDSGSGSAKRVGKPPSLWSGDDWSGPGKEMQKPYETIRDMVKDWNDFVDDILGGEFLPDWAKGLAKVPGVDKFLNIPGGPKTMAYADNRGLGFDDNPSLEVLPERPWESESRSQWVRATYPHVDAFRQPAREVFHELFGMSNASTYYVNWTNRYTIDRSHTLRTGDFGPPHMMVLEDMLPDQKGNEPWTADAARADQLFSVVGFARREGRRAVFSPQIYRNPGLRTGGDVAYAQALVYNANGRDLNAPGSGPGVQPNTGWDTLNWEPTVRAPEWGADPTAGPGGGSSSDLAQVLELPDRLLEVFGGSRDATETTRVRLNWQVKLVAVSPPRLGQAVEGAGASRLPAAIRDRLRPALPFVGALGRH